ncbi:MAG: hypothetical protein ACOY0T_20890 [Myxococcota bacterium]
MNPCRSGLTCVAGTCAPGGNTKVGGACLISPECRDGQCVEGVCAAAGEGDVGATCEGDRDCLSSQRCQLAGLFSACEPQGVGDIGAHCAANLDCFGGLYCVSGSCVRPSQAAPFGGTPFAGVDCGSEVSGDPRAYFEVPGASESAPKDFFRLPFPNDVRRGSDGRLNLSGFPTPGVGALGFDPVVRYVDALEERAQGFGTDPVVLFRFSSALSSGSLESASAIHYVDVTEGSASFGKEVGARWTFSTERTPYVCANWLAIARPLGAPLSGGHVYAVYLTDVLTTNSKGVKASPNLRSVLADATPSDAALATAHARYAPLRSHLAAAGVNPTDVVAATVFSVEDPRADMSKLAVAVEGARVPKLHDVVKCEAGAVSPCPDHSGPRACEQSESFDEYHALVDLPIFQQGIAPYVAPDDGGGVNLERAVRYEPVCLSLTVPKQAMPDAGWPLVVFAHGTGGSFRDHATPGVAGALTQATLADGTPFPMAVLGIDQVEHGPRRGDSNQAPENLFFNIANPAAARGNPLQGAADQLSLARLATAFDVEVAGTAIRVDANKVVFFGHSQGSTQGSLMLPFSSVYKAAVLSGNGASLRESLLNKKKPADVRAVLPQVLSDRTLENDSVAHAHPVLTLLSQWIDSADPLNFAAAVALEPIAPVPAHHLFQTYGSGDSYSPATTLQAYAIAGGLSLVGPNVPEPFGLTPLAAPLAGNEGGVTLGVREYAARLGSDGHFVVFDVAAANRDVVRFLAQAANGDVPAIGE